MLSGAESLQSCQAWFLCGVSTEAGFLSLDLQTYGVWDGKEWVFVPGYQFTKIPEEGDESVSPICEPG